MTPPTPLRRAPPVPLPQEQVDQAVAKARRLADPLYATIERLQQPMIVSDCSLPDNPIILANQAFLDLTGYALDEIVGRNCRFLQGPETDLQSVDRLRQAIRNREEITETLLNYRKDGSRFWSKLFIAPVLDEAGEAIYFFASQLDMTEARESKRIRSELRKRSQEFEALVENVSQLSWMAHPDGQIYWYNKRWYKYTGTTLETMLGWGWRDVHLPDRVDEIIAEVKGRWALGKAWEGVYYLRSASGEYHPFLTRAEPIYDEEGELVRWFGTNTDITELREAEEAMAAARDAAEEANTTKSAFIANMSHELRTPLSAIIGYSEMLQEEMIDGADASELATDVGKIEANARHLLGLINDVLDLSKLESGKMEVYAETFNVETVVNDVASTAQGLITKKANALVVRLEPNLGTMRSDVTKLKQILLNLLSNAAKFTENGTITLSAIRLPGGNSGDWVVFRVADTGLGMDDEQLGRLFQRFTQADASTTRKYGGTGLGLSISKAFGVMLGGDLSVDSAPDEGSTFTVFVPAVIADESEPAKADAGDALIRGTAWNDREVVLVIDDDPSQRDLMTRFLGREGFGAVTAADGFAGLQLARTVQPRAILLDVTMPGLDGWSVLSALKADPAVAAIPVIMVTFVDDRGLAASLGAADYVMKPVKWEGFRRVMERFRGADSNVLVVDDDADMRHQTRSVLERDGWAVVEATNGRDALDRVAEALPHAVLLDLEMPVMDGFDFLRAFRNLPGCTNIPVVVLTAKDLTRDDRLRLHGAAEVLSKGVVSLGTLSKELKAATQAAT